MAYYWEDENCIKPPLIVIAGPTGVGKTRASVRLAKRVDGEIISADSMQVYRHMDIGTAKVTRDEMEGVPHHLIDIMEPGQDYDVTMFKDMAKQAAEDIRSRGHIPIVCGGTGFYIQALIYDIDFTEETDRERSEEIRRRYYEEAEKLGRAAVHERLRTIDRASYDSIPAGNLKRVVRALEFYEIHGEPISAHNERERQKRGSSPYDCRFFALTDDRQRLYERIDERVDRMMEQGLLEEARRLFELGIPEGSTCMQAIGYKELLAHLRGKLNLEETIEEIKKDSRHYAKRQLTWLRREKDVIEINISETGDVIDELEKYLQCHGHIRGDI